MNRRTPLPRLAGQCAAAGGLALLLAGCASPGQPQQQTLRIETPGCHEVRCELSNGEGRWVLERTPGNVTLTTSHTPLALRCQASEGTQASSAAPASLPPVTGKGALLGGAAGGAAVGVGVGAAALAYIPPLGVVAVLTGIGLGAASGSAVESSQRGLRYPELISVPMVCAGAVLPPPRGDGLGIVARGLSAEEARTAGLTGHGAARVIAVAPGSRAARGGLREGDLVLAANGLDVDDPLMLQGLLRAAPAGSAWTLTVLREGRVIALVLPPPAAASAAASATAP